jgi:hypothetical protein
MPKLGYGYKHCMSLLQLMIYELHMILLKYITIYHTLFADSLICQKGLSKYYVIIECSTTVGRVPLQIYSDCCLMPTQLFLYPHSPKGEGGILFYLCPSVLPSVQDIFRRIFLSNCWWQKSDIWSQVSYRYTIMWVVFLDPSDSYFLFADLVGFYTHWTYIHIFRHIFLSNYW